MLVARPAVKGGDMSECVDAARDPLQAWQQQTRSVVTKVPGVLATGDPISRDIRDNLLLSPSLL